MYLLSEWINCCRSPSSIGRIRLEAALRRIITVWHQSTARAIREQTDPMHSNHSRGTLMSYGEHSAQRCFFVHPFEARDFNVMKDWQWREPIAFESGMWRIISLVESAKQSRPQLGHIPRFATVSGLNDMFPGNGVQRGVFSCLVGVSKMSAQSAATCI